MWSTPSVSALCTRSPLAALTASRFRLFRSASHRFNFSPSRQHPLGPLGSLVELALEWRHERRIREKVVQLGERVGFERVLRKGNLGGTEGREIGRGGLEHVQEEECFLLFPSFAGLM